MIYLCSRAGCGAHLPKPGYCPECKRQKQRDKRARRSYRSKHLSSIRDSAAWQRARARAKERDGHRCRLCGSTDRLEVHHVRALSRGGDPYHLNNLITLCRGCHAAQGEGEGVVRVQAALTRLSPGFREKQCREKTCRHCGETKAASDFPHNRNVSDGLSSWCRACHNEASAKWRAEHSEEISEYGRRRYAERVAAAAKEFEPIRREHLLRLREQTAARRLQRGARSRRGR
jgi:hypothetical protein